MQQEIRSEQAHQKSLSASVLRRPVSASTTRPASSALDAVHGSTKAHVTRVKKLLTLLVVGVLVVTGVMAITARFQQRTGSHVGDADDPVPVLADQARVADVPVYFEGVGTVRALNMVTVHSQVDGQLISVNFREGQNVKAGDVLARIDPTTYQAQLDQAIAKKALDEAQLANARLDLERYTNLLNSTQLAGNKPIRRGRSSRSLRRR